ncbi:hypothetical protein AVEN_231951-1 [Araneus ventricosus]|uniref:Uncharacterized protein n=1 Tax=Araneus ventricosus TaxID=182803 RepID=A0A4Y2C0D0_ARAVE|nr:hypothetical protein AVEN_231951-1 [Araneus ventricosus]
MRVNREEVFISNPLQQIDLFNLGGGSLGKNSSHLAKERQLTDDQFTDMSPAFVNVPVNDDSENKLYKPRRNSDLPKHAEFSLGYSESRPIVPVL